MKYRVNLCITFTVEAEDEAEAENRAYEMLEKELRTPQALYELFGSNVEAIQ